MVNTSRDKQRTWLIQAILRTCLIQVEINMVNTSRDKQRTWLIQVEINKEHG